MLRRDLILVEIEKLAQVLAKIIGLKQEGKLEDADALLEGTLRENFNLELSVQEISMLEESEFSDLLSRHDYKPEKLDKLAELLYARAFPFDDSSQTQLLLEKVLRIFDILEQQHHRQSFENLQKRQIINAYIRRQQHG